mgnify:CR=1 FL=1
MPKMNGTGPEGRGAKTGRGLGKCKKVTDDEALKRLGKGLGERRNAGGGTGRGKRLQCNGEKRN